jgi:4-hydroxymandelate oxidase
VLNLLELESLARARLDPQAFDYYRSGANDELTLRKNRDAFDALEIHYRVLVDVSKRELTCTILGRKLEFPVLVAPTAFHRLAHPDGERATARAAATAGSHLILSTLSTTPLEEIGNLGPFWFQLYVYRDRGATAALVRRAEAAGASAIVVTVDAPLLGRREADVRNGFRLPPGLAVANLLAEGYGEVPSAARESGLAAYFATLIDSSFSWKDLDWLRGLTRLPILIKGVVRPDDAARAVDNGIAGIVVSNHGGRQLDTSPATIRVLPAVAQAVGSRVPILLDGGVRRGTDVLKALALGANAVLVGRPILWGLALGGSEGVESVLRTLRDELDLALALAGCASVREISRDLVTG